MRQDVDGIGDHHHDAAIAFECLRELLNEERILPQQIQSRL
jgi:hypothetical protein